MKVETRYETSQAHQSIAIRPTIPFPLLARRGRQIFDLTALLFHLVSANGSRLNSTAVRHTQRMFIGIHWCYSLGQLL
jgi:hypothetical protein